MCDSLTLKERFLMCSDQKDLSCFDLVLCMRASLLGIHYIQPKQAWSHCINDLFSLTCQVEFFTALQQTRESSDSSTSLLEVLRVIEVFLHSCVFTYRNKFGEMKNTIFWNTKPKQWHSNSYCHQKTEFVISLS